MVKFLCLYPLWFGVLQAIQLDRVILSTNNNPHYIEFWPVVAPIWKAMGLEPTLALIAKEDCCVDTTLGDVIRFHPLEGVSEASQAQLIRLLLPALFPDEGCLISDIDMIPIAKGYFHFGASHCPDNAFLVYNDGAYFSDARGQYPICYIAAKGRIFASVFSLSDPNEIETTLRHWISEDPDWFADEKLLYRCVNEWEKKRGGTVIRLGHPVGPRLDRSWWYHDFEKIQLRGYIDCHCPRPYSRYKTSIDLIAQAVLDSLKKN